MAMDVSYDMTVREMVAKYGRKVLDWKVVDVAVLAEAKQQQRADGLADTMTLTEFYARCYKPEVSDAKGLADDTYRQREKALWYWAKVTGNPALRDIDKRTMNEFVKQMQEQQYLGRTLSPATIHKHCSALRSVLDYAGPKTEKNSNAKELIPMPPAFPPIRVYLNPTAKTPTKEEVDAMEVAEYPKLLEISAPQWWRCAYLFLALTGVEKVIPLSTEAQDVLNQMPRGRPDDLIFQWPHSETRFYEQRQEIVDAAGISRPIRGTWHAMRRFVATPGTGCTTCPWAYVRSYHPVALSEYDAGSDRPGSSRKGGGFWIWIKSIDFRAADVGSSATGSLQAAKR